MARIYLVRHGEATAGWGLEENPGLSEHGLSQARTVAQKLSPLGPIDIVSSPLARARETSVPLAEIWKVVPRIENKVGEIPSPPGNTIERTEWLRDVMSDKWPNLRQNLQEWRRGVIEALCLLDKDTVVFTHFIAINTVYGEATKDDRVVCFLPDNCSATTIEIEGNSLVLIEKGSEASTVVR